MLSSWINISFGGFNGLVSKNAGNIFFWVTPKLGNCLKNHQLSSPHLLSSKNHIAGAGWQLGGRLSDESQDIPILLMLRNTVFLWIFPMKTAFNMEALNNAFKKNVADLWYPPHRYLTLVGWYSIIIVIISRISLFTLLLLTK